MHFQGVTSVKVGCMVDDYEEALYQILPHTETKYYTLYGHTINVLPYSIKKPFIVLDGLEFYYYTPIYEIRMNFRDFNEEQNLKFYLFSKTSLAKITICLDRILIECTVNNGMELKCPIIPRILVLEKNHFYEPYILDTNNKIKRNYFVNPIEINLQFLE